jgi:hypothetical protein
MKHPKRKLHDSRQQSPEKKAKIGAFEVKPNGTPVGGKF